MSYGPARMIFGIAVHGAPYGSQASASALRFAEAAVAAGHSLHRVFFYHDGVNTANGLMVPPQDDPSPQQGWVNLAEYHGIELAVCIAAALKRGLVNEAGAQSLRAGMRPVCIRRSASSVSVS